MTNKYTAINIGPIIDTLSMGRKPRELWNASYMFSFLMECIIDEIHKKGLVILSPAQLGQKKILDVGLYPDRLFIDEGPTMEDTPTPSDSVKEAKADALKRFAKQTGIDDNYVNVMMLSIKCDVENSDKVISELNRLLDCLELYQRPIDDASHEKTLSLLQGKENIFNDEHTKFNKIFLSEIAIGKLADNKDVAFELGKLYTQKNDEDISTTEDDFYRSIKKYIPGEFYSHYKYLCIVQADGDRMGEIISRLCLNDVKTLSESLLAYGKDSTELIMGYGGFPIYAGGDDLLFIAPVVSDEKNIIDLINEIDALYKREVDGVLSENPDSDNQILRPTDEDGKYLHTTLSYGLSISYYKYPLYESLNTARSLLFDVAKRVDSKNALAWKWQKHSGSSFSGTIVKNHTAGSTYEVFNEIIKADVKEAVISAVSYKLRSCEDLLEGISAEGDTAVRNDRLKYFYNKFLELPLVGGDSYVRCTYNLLSKLFEDKDGLYKRGESTYIKQVISSMYGMLRVAKFINGEREDYA